MKNVLNIIKQHAWKILAVVFFTLFLAKGCTFRKISKLDKKYDLLNSQLENKIDSLHKLANSKASKEEIKQEMEHVMFNYLIYEDDLDKGKISLSDIKNKIK